MKTTIFMTYVVAVFGGALVDVSIFIFRKHE